jgi:hypothetical protein
LRQASEVAKNGIFSLRAAQLDFTLCVAYFSTRRGASNSPKSLFAQRFLVMADAFFIWSAK